ncbi:MAG: hypothetical protein V3U84_04200 [Thiotrichaceae bacterium]
MDNSDNAYITGSFDEAVTFWVVEAGETTLTDNNSGRYMFVAKYTANGNLVWAKRAADASSARNANVAEGAVTSMPYKQLSLSSAATPRWIRLWFVPHTIYPYSLHAFIKSFIPFFVTANNRIRKILRGNNNFF